MSSESPFLLFELDPEIATVADVKRAYAKLLKVTRPDTDPAGFMALRAAMESAVMQIKWRDQQEHEPPETDTPVMASAESTHRSLGAKWTRPDDHQEVPEAVETELAPPAEPAKVSPFHLDDAERVRLALDEVIDLLQRPGRRNNWKAWLAILDRDAFEGFDTYQLLSNSLRGMICEQSGFYSNDHRAILPLELDPDILISLDERYGWSQQTSYDWRARQENAWIARLVDRARYMTGKQPPNTELQPVWGQPNTTIGGNTANQNPKLNIVMWICYGVILILGLGFLVYMTTS